MSYGRFESDKPVNLFGTGYGVDPAEARGVIDDFKRLGHCISNDEKTIMICRAWFMDMRIDFHYTGHITPKTMKALLTEDSEK